MTEILLLTVCFFLVLWILKSNKARALSFFIFLITMGFAVFAHIQHEKVWNVTINGETFKAKNVLRSGGVIQGERLDGRAFASNQATINE